LTSTEATAGGVSLTKYAEVSAAIDETLPLKEALDSVGLNERAWQRAKVEWRKRIAGDPAQFDAYRAELAKAQDKLSRKVWPIDEDPAAWVAFLHAMGKSDAPGPWLEQKGLTMNDLARLSRRWERKSKEDDALAKRLAELQKNPGPMPALRLGPLATLEKANAAAKEGDDPAKAPDVSPLVLPSAYRPKSREPAGAPLPEPAPAGVWAPSPLSPIAPAIVPTVAPAIAPAIAPPAIAPAIVPAPPALAATSLDLGLARGPALPFVPGGPAAPLPPSSPKAPPIPTGTSLSLDVPRGPALPFARSAKAEGVSPSASAPPSPSPPPLVPPPATLFAETSPLPDVPRGPALPFTKDSAPKPPPPSPLAPPAPPAPERQVASIASIKQHLGDTAPVLKVSKLPVTPFGPPSASSQKAKHLEETSLGFTIPKNLPPAASARRAEPAPAPPQAAPPASPTTPAPAPRLSLEQYASLCVELGLYPDRAALTLKRYGVSPAQKDALNRYYHAALAADPALRDRWEAACRTYRDWLIQSTKR
jgi:hypothetical protein